VQSGTGTGNGNRARLSLIGEPVCHVRSAGEPGTVRTTTTPSIPRRAASAHDADARRRHAAVANELRHDTTDRIDRNGKADSGIGPGRRIDRSVHASFTSETNTPNLVLHLTRSPDRSLTVSARSHHDEESPMTAGGVPRKPWLFCRFAESARRLGAHGIFSARFAYDAGRFV
jgi:hypothetical protein